MTVIQGRDRLADGVMMTLPTFRLQGAAIRHGRPEGMPVYVTASGPRMLEMAGEIADGVLFLAGSDPRCVRYALDRIAAGAERSGRKLSDLFLGCNIYGALEEDPAVAYAACRSIAAWFPQTSPQYAELIGVPSERIAAIRAAYGGGHFDEARRALELVTDDMIEAFRLASTRSGISGATLVIAGERAVTTRELIASFCEAFDLPRPSVRIPYAAAVAMAVVAESVCRVVNVEPPISRRTLEFFDTSNAFDIARAHEKLGFAPRYSLQAGLNASRHWLESGLVPQGTAKRTHGRHSA